jgi:TolB-like protein/Tfp pilus assembly protein PilF/predicted Ser/Thr protein kinase
MLGQTFGHYRIIEKIGAGGMGEVYRARDEQLHRDVALKVLPTQLLSDDSARRLLIREARTASSLNHPNICTIHSVGENDDRNFIVMEFLDGRPLSDLIAEAGDNGLPVDTVIRYGEQIADALSHAHKHGVIHRDLKSSNIMISPEGRAKVLDFGLAKRHRVEGVSELTHSQHSSANEGGVGTMLYTAPEVFKGEPTDVRSDIWSLGVVLYEMTSGARPFGGKTTYEVISRILHEQPPELSPNVSPVLKAVIDKCLMKAPSERYQSASEVRTALSILGAHTPASQATVNALVADAARDRSRRRWILIDLAIFGAILLLVMAWKFAPRFSHTGAAAVGPASIHSIAVLPLENLSRDPAQDYFADGMTDELTTQLAQISALRVISRTSVEQYKDNNKKSLPEIAKELHVDGVVEGSVMQSGDRVRITAQLIQASNDKHLWAKSYEGDTRDVLGLQQEVAHAIADEIKVQLTPQEKSRLTSPRPVNPAAYDAYLKGAYLNKGTGAGMSTVQQQRKAKDFFEQAIQLDPNYAPAYAGLADYYWSSLDLRPTESMPKAKENVVKALALDPDLAQAHTELGAIHFYADWDWDGADKEFRTALALNPGDEDAHHYYSFYLAAMGRADEAVAESQKALDLDPLSISTQVNAGFILYFTHQYDKAVDQCRRALELDTNSAGAYDCLGSSYLAAGKYEEAIAAFQKAVTLSNSDAPRLVGLARAYAMADRRAEAQKIREQLRLLGTRQYVPTYYFAQIDEALGKNDEALAALEKAYTERDVYMPWVNVDIAFDTLRADERFRALLQRIGFTA